MPTYEYECTRCGHHFELFQSISEPPRKRCPECRGKVNRLIGTGAGLLFKGSGFYSTDYRSDSYKAGAKEEKKSASPDTGKSSKDSARSESGKKGKKE
jgi:putative FmdB family regulatory protein